jgi:hypothetical protein
VVSAVATQASREHDTGVLHSGKRSAARLVRYCWHILRVPARCCPVAYRCCTYGRQWHLPRLRLHFVTQLLSGYYHRRLALPALGALWVFARARIWSCKHGHGGDRAPAGRFIPVLVKREPLATCSEAATIHSPYLTYGAEQQRVKQLVLCPWYSYRHVPQDGFIVFATHTRWRRRSFKLSAFSRPALRQW